MGTGRGSSGENRATSSRWRPSAVLASSRIARTLARLAILCLVLVAWELAAQYELINPSFFSSPTEIWRAFLDYYHTGQLVDSAWATLRAVALAFVIGTVTGTLAGLVLGVSPTLDILLGSFMVPLNSMPRIALAPLFILWFGLTDTSKVALAVTVVFFLLAMNMRASVKSVDPDLITMARVTGLGRTRLMWSVLLPNSVPTLFAGIRLAITYSLLGVVASEMIAARAGLGVDLVAYSASFNVATVFAILALLAVVATAVNVALESLESWLLRWQAT